MFLFVEIKRSLDLIDHVLGAHVPVFANIHSCVVADLINQARFEQTGGESLDLGFGCLWIEVQITCGIACLGKGQLPALGLRFFLGPGGR